MSGDETRSALVQAHQLVEAGKYDEARAILDPIIAADQNNADAWWIYAHAVTSAEEGRHALERVLQLDPNYPGAADLMAIARKRAAPEHEQPTIKPLTPKPQAPPSLPEDQIPEPEEAPTEPVEAAVPAAPTTSAPRRQASILSLVAIIVVIVIAVVAIILLSQSSGGQATPTPRQAALIPSPTAIPINAAVPTEQVAAPTQEIVAPTATLELTAEPTIPVPTSSGTEVTASGTEDFSALYQVLGQYPVIQNGITEAQTSLGNTVLVSVCSAPGAEMRRLLPQVMDAFAKQSTTLDSSVQAIGARIIDCDHNAPLLTVAVDLPTAIAYAHAQLTDAQFAAAWQRQ